MFRLLFFGVLFCTRQLGPPLLAHGWPELSIPFATSMTLSNGQPPPDELSYRVAYWIAIEHLNEDNEGLGLPYRFRAHPTCDTEQTVFRAYECAVEMQRLSPVGIVGGTYSSVTLHIAVLATEWRRLQCSPTATSPALSSQSRYPYFFRVISPDDAVAQTTITVMTHFQWWRAAVIHTTDSYGAGLAEKIAMVAQQTKGGSMRLSYYSMEPSFHVTLSPAVMAKLKRDITFGIRSSQIKIIISVLVEGDVDVILQWCWESGLTGPDYVWIGYDAFIAIEVLQTDGVAAGAYTDSTLPMPALDMYANLLKISQKIATTNRTARVLATAREKFQTTINTSYAFLTYDCVIAIGAAVQALLRQNPALSPSDLLGSTSSSSSSGSSSGEVAAQLRDMAFNQEFEGASGWVSFAKAGTANAGDRDPIFSISQWDPRGFWADLGVHDMTGAEKANSPIVFTRPVNFSGATELEDSAPSCLEGTEFDAALSFAAKRDVCQPCPAGKYRRDRMRTPCLTCPPGFKCDSGINGTREPQSCEPGHFSGEGASQCSACARGSFISTPAAVQCIQCPHGQFQMNPAATLCDTCPVGYFQSELGSTQCQACPETQSTKTAASTSQSSCGCPPHSRWAADVQRCVECQQGLLDCERFNATPRVMQGYYLEEGAARDTERIELFLCNVAEWCPGEQQLGDPMCAMRREGLNCGRCAQGFFESGQSCRPCAGLYTTIYVLGGVALFLASGLVLLLGGRKDEQKVNEGRVFLSVTVGTTLAVLQRLGMIGRIGVSWPRTVKRVLSLCTDVFFSDFLALRPPCALPSSLFTMYLARVCTPLFFVFCCVVWWSLTQFVNRSVTKRLPTFSVFHVVNTTGLFISALYIYTVMGTLSLVDCYKNPNGTRTIREFSFALCSGADFNAAIPLFTLGMLTYVVGMVGVTLYALWVAPNRYAKGSGFRVMIRFLVTKFRPDKYWYTLVTMLSSFLMALVTVIFPDSKFSQLTCMQLIACFQFSAHCHHMPYTRHAANVMVNTEYCALVVLLILGSYFYQEPIQSSAITSLAHTILGLLTLKGLLVLCGVGWGLLLALCPQRIGVRQRAETGMDSQVQSILTGCRKIVAQPEEFRELLSESASYIERERAAGILNFLNDAMNPNAQVSRQTSRGRLFRKSGEETLPADTPGSAELPGSLENVFAFPGEGSGVRRETL